MSYRLDTLLDEPLAAEGSGNFNSQKRKKRDRMSQVSSDEGNAENFSDSSQWDGIKRASVLAAPVSSFLTLVKDFYNSIFVR